MHQAPSRHEEASWTKDKASDHCENTAGRNMQEKLSKAPIKLAKKIRAKYFILHLALG